jgi:two-component system heavy metal sensor histidine kinase CusS
MLDELELAFDGIRSFTANAALELRTPLATLRCELEVAIGRDRPAGEYRETLASALEGTRTLSATIENLLFLAKADSSAAVPDEARVDLSGILEHVGGLFEALAEAGDVDLSVDVAPGLTVSGNTEWLKMAFANLLNNAVKYTPAGGRVLLSACKGGGRVRVSVEDTGPGIPPEDLERVFDRFYRADNSRQHRTGGVGLGLSITKRIIDLHGGRITVRSASGKGSTFGVLLPHGETP